MTNAIYFHFRHSLKNYFKNLIRSPLKLLGTIVLLAYFIGLPFTLNSIVTDFNLNNPIGFVLSTTALTLYVVMPSTLSYFKRKGVIFRKQDVNLMLATPVSPKKALVYALIKQAYITFIFQIVVIMSAIFLFNITIWQSFLYGIIDIVLSSLMQYSLALIMYASETISNKQKNTIKYIVYFTLFAITILIAYTIYLRGFSMANLTQLLSHPFILLIPLFGWQLGWLNLIILGPTTVNIISSSLFIITAIGLTWIAYSMKCTGDYYEDALSFSEKQALIESKKGSSSLKDAFGSKTKAKNYKGTLKGQKSQAIFFRQVIQRRRSTRFVISFLDFLYLFVGIVGGFSLAQILPHEYFFIAGGTVTIYLSLFFGQGESWTQEFSQASIYIIPSPNSYKLFYATLLDHFISLLRITLLTLPFGIIIQAPLMTTLLSIIAQLLIRIMAVYISILTKEILGSMIGKIIAQFVNILILIVAMLVPIAGLVLSVFMSVFIGFAVIAVYCVVMIILLLYIGGKVLSQLESISM